MVHTTSTDRHSAITETARLRPGFLWSLSRQDEGRHAVTGKDMCQMERMAPPSIGIIAPVM